MILPQNWVATLGLNTLADDRIYEVFPHLRGHILDIGCGNNSLVQAWGQGVGVDIVDWAGEVDFVCADTSNLPFGDAEFDVVTFLACLNHIPNRREVLREAYRILKPGGTIIATMISPQIGKLCHKLIRQWDPDQREREMDVHEAMGLDSAEMVALLSETGLLHIRMKRFGFLGLNHLFVGLK